MLEQNTNKKKRIKSIAIYLFMIVALSFLFYNPYRIDKKIRDNRRYTIGKVYKESSTLKNGEHYHYKFNYNGKEYEAYNLKENNYKVEFGERFIVEFSSKEPEYSKILYKYKVTKLINSPKDGWEKIPVDSL